MNKLGFRHAVLSDNAGSRSSAYNSSKVLAQRFNLGTIYRIAFGMNFSGNIESLFLSAKSMKFETLDECTRLFLNSKLRLVLLLECMMIAAGFENGKRRAMEYISQLAVMLNVGKDEIEFLANLARVVLTQDLNEYKTDFLNVYGDIFDCYIDVFSGYLKIELITVSRTKRFEGLEYNISSVREKGNGNISFTYQCPIVRTFLGTKNDSKQIEIDTSDKIVNYLNHKITKVKNNAEKNNHEKLIFGVMSNHPLAHSKAIAQYIAAGGVIDKQDK